MRDILVCRKCPAFRRVKRGQRQQFWCTQMDTRPFRKETYVRGGLSGVEVFSKGFTWCLRFDVQSGNPEPVRRSVPVCRRCNHFCSRFKTPEGRDTTVERMKCTLLALTVNSQEPYRTIDHYQIRLPPDGCPLFLELLVLTQPGE